MFMKHASTRTDWWYAAAGLKNMTRQADNGTATSMTNEQMQMMMTMMMQQQSAGV
jgi:hypothetical protein